jgi:hypothetical protein
LQRLYGGFQSCGIEQVGRDRMQPVDVSRRTPRQTADLPALPKQVAGQVVAHDAADPGDQC